MAVSKEMRLLLKKWWSSNQGWPKRLEAVEITGIRGWSGQRIDFNFPIVAIVGENGAGKSTILQAAASVYKSANKKPKFASTYFPDTPWDKITKATIKWWIREGKSSREGSIRKETTRWRGNPERRERNIENIDLSRIQPVFARTGYFRLAKPQHKEISSAQFDEAKLNRLSEIMGKKYGIAAMSVTDFDTTRSVPVVSYGGTKYSGFHGGAGETTMIELLKSEIAQHSLVLIDEIETSLHPRAQRRLMRDLAEICRVKEVQVILSTHSPYILDELPEAARMYIWEGAAGREIIQGVSPEFAMTKMDLEKHPECDVYVEDDRSAALLTELIVEQSKDLVSRCMIVPYGAASVGQALGQMVQGKRFPRPTCVFLDGDQSAAPGCAILPGGDAPENVVFEGLKEKGWQGLSVRVDRPHSAIADACSRAMSASDAHEWIKLAADELVIGGDVLWQAMCSVWAKTCVTPEKARHTVDLIQEALT